MAADNEINLEIQVQVNDAVKQIQSLTNGFDEFRKDFKAASDESKEFSKSIKNSISSISSGFDLLKGAAVAAIAVFTTGAVADFFSESIEASKGQEDALNSLNTALSNTGKFSEAASQSMQEFASELQATSTIGDEVALSTASLIQSLGNLDTEGLKRATQAAADLSAALGIDLETAARLVGKAAAGEVGTLKKYGVAIKDTGDTAKDFALALDVLESKFGGAAASKILTFSGAIAQTKNLFGDIQEEIGGLITNNPAVIASISQLGKAFQFLIVAVKDNSTELTGFVTTLVQGLANSVPIVVASIGALVDTIAFLTEKILLARAGINVAAQALGKFADFLGLLSGGTVNGVAVEVAQLDDELQGIFKSIEDSKATYQKFSDGLDNLGVASAEFAKNLGTIASETEAARKSEDRYRNNLVDTNDIVKELTDSEKEAAKQRADATAALLGQVTRIKDAVKDAGLTLEEILVRDLKDNIDILTKALNEGLISFQEFNKTAEQLGVKFSDDLQKSIKDARKEAEKSVEVQVEVDFVGLLSKSFAVGVDILRGFLTGDFVKQFENAAKEFDDLAQKFISEFPAIVDGLVARFPQIAQTIANAATGFIRVLLQNLPKLIAAIPTLLQPLIDAIPGIIQEIARNIGPITEALVVAAGEIASQLILAAPDIIIALSENLEPLIVGLVNGLIIALPQIVAALSTILADEISTGRISSAILKAIVNAQIAAGKILLQQLTEGASRIGQIVIDGFKQGFTELGDFLTNTIRTAIIDGIEGVADTIRDAFSIKITGADTQSVGERIGGALGFATGGVIPPGYPNDNFGANLSSDERVLSVDQNKVFEKLLRAVDALGGKSAGGGMVQVTLQVGQKQLADAIFDLNRAGFRTA